MRKRESVKKVMWEKAISSLSVVSSPIGDCSENLIESFITFFCLFLTSLLFLSFRQAQHPAPVASASPTI
jgi:hypothetical protein